MKVKCIRNGGMPYLAIGKTYETIYIYRDSEYKIMDDCGDDMWFPKEWFKSLAEYRNEKINKLLA